VVLVAMLAVSVGAALFHFILMLPRFSAPRTSWARRLRRIACPGSVGCRL